MIYLAIASAFLVWAVSDWWRDVQYERQCARVEREYYQREHDTLARIAEAERMAQQVADDIHDRDWSVRQDGTMTCAVEHRFEVDGEEMYVLTTWTNKPCTVDELLGHTVTEEGE